MVTLTLSEMLPAGTYEVTRQGDAPPVVVPPVAPPVEAPTGGVLDVFSWLGGIAPEYVRWRYVQQIPEPARKEAVQGALIAQMGQLQFSQKMNDVSYNSPQAPLINHRIYWWDKTSPPPPNVADWSSAGPVY